MSPSGPDIPHIRRQAICVNECNPSSCQLADGLDRSASMQACDNRLGLQG